MTFYLWQHAQYEDFIDVPNNDPPEKFSTLQEAKNADEGGDREWHPGTTPKGRRAWLSGPGTIKNFKALIVEYED